MQTIEPTRFHRLLKADLGAVPKWICSNSNGGISVADLLPGSILAIGWGSCSAMALIIGYWVIPLILLTIVATTLLRRETLHLKEVERKCRARIRRFECLNCGTKLEAESEKYCSDCGRIANMPTNA